MKTYEELPNYLKNYIDDRYSNHNISAKEGYDSWPDEMKNLSPDDMFDTFSKKHISHIESQYNNPEKSDDINNTFLEDPDINIKRGSENASNEEIESAYEDLQSEIDEINDENDLLSDLNLNSEKSFDSEEINEYGNDYYGDIDDDIMDFIGTSIGVGVPILSLAETYDKFKSGEIDPNSIKKYYVKVHGKRTLIYMLTGAAIASSSTFIVSVGVANIVYRNLNLISVIKEKYKNDREFWSRFESFH